MMKKILTAIAMFTMTAMPVVSGVHADQGSFEPIMAEAAWSYADYRVERLAFAPNAVGPISIGPAVLIAEPTDAVLNYHVSMLKNGMKLTWTNVPSEAFDAHAYAKNGNRLVYVQAANFERSTYALIERNLETGQPTTLVKEAFFQSPTAVRAMVDGNYFFNPEYPFKNGFAQAGTEVWNAAEQKSVVIHPHWYSKTLRREEIQDTRDGVALVKMVFERANEELWFMDSNTPDHAGMTNSPVPGTWTEQDGDIVAAHFRSDGSVEFFKNFVRYTYNSKTDTEAVRHEGEFLNWYRPVERAYQISGDRMAWVNAEDRLFVSDLSGVTEIGTATEGQFLLDGNRLFYATGYGVTGQGAVYNLTTKTTETLSFAVTDTLGDTVVGVDGTGNVQYRNLATGRGLKLGFGTAPVISDEAHVYWKGVDGIYEATVNAAKKLSLNPVRALRVAGESQIWLVKDGVRKAIKNPETYFTWFDSWASVETVSFDTLRAYPDEGIALFAPGTKVKATDSREVFLVGGDGKLHWIVDEPAAWRIFGESWNKNIVVVAPNVLFDYMTGNSISTEQEAQQI
jgi:hypothetical protein